MLKGVWQNIQVLVSSILFSKSRLGLLFNTSKVFLTLFCSFFLLQCIEKDPNANTRERIETKNTTGSIEEYTEYGNENIVYVPIYSDIYNKNKDIRILLTATLSIRNTSPLDSLFITKVDYYDTQGKLVRQYIDETIFLRPLESFEYVIEEEDVLGGSGANFIVSWYGKEALQPLFQGIMVGVNGQQGIAFTTDGYSISQ